MREPSPSSSGTSSVAPPTATETGPQGRSTVTASEGSGPLPSGRMISPAEARGLSSPKRVTTVATSVSASATTVPAARIATSDQSLVGGSVGVGGVSLVCIEVDLLACGHGSRAHVALEGELLLEDEFLRWGGGVDGEDGSSPAAGGGLWRGETGRARGRVAVARRRGS